MRGGISRFIIKFVSHGGAELSLSSVDGGGKGGKEAFRGGGWKWEARWFEGNVLGSESRSKAGGEGLIA